MNLPVAGKETWLPSYIVSWNYCLRRKMGVDLLLPAHHQFHAKIQGTDSGSSNFMSIISLFHPVFQVTQLIQLRRTPTWEALPRIWGAGCFHHINHLVSGATPQGGCKLLSACLGLWLGSRRTIMSLSLALAHCCPLTCSF